MMKDLQRPSFTDEDARWQALVGRDRAADGHFVYAVKTTGIYCAPSCSSRQPNRQNVEFFADGESAAAAGYRPCKRCRQGRVSLQQQYGQQVEQACRLLEDAEKRRRWRKLPSRWGSAPGIFIASLKPLPA